MAPVPLAAMTVLQRLTSSLTPTSDEPDEATKEIRNTLIQLGMNSITASISPRLQARCAATRLSAVNDSGEADRPITALTHGAMKMVTPMPGIVISLGSTNTT